MGKQADQPAPDWEAIERDYRAGALSIRQIADIHGVSHPAILKKAKKEGWQRNLAGRVREEVTRRLVTDEVTEEEAATEQQIVDQAASVGVAVVRAHRNDIQRGRQIVEALLEELRDVTSNREKVTATIDLVTLDAKSTKERTSLMRAVSLPSRAATVSSLSLALKTLVGLERQAYGLDGAEKPDEIADIAALLEAARTRGKTANPG